MQCCSLDCLTAFDVNTISSMLAGSTYQTNQSV